MSEESISFKPVHSGFKPDSKVNLSTFKYIFLMYYFIYFDGNLASKLYNYFFFPFIKEILILEIKFFKNLFNIRGIKY